MCSSSEKKYNKKQNAFLFWSSLYHEAGVAAQKEKARRDADFLRRQIEAKNEAEACERRRMLEADSALDFIARERRHAPRDPAADRAAAAEYRQALDHQNDRKKQHMWDAFVSDRLDDEKHRVENLLAIGRRHLQRRTRRETETADLRGAWARAVDAKREASAAAAAAV